MAQLIVENGALEGTTLTLSREQPCTVGRDEGCDLALSDAGVADQHVVVKALREDGFGVKSLGTAFSINGQAIQAARLMDGDVLELGGVPLRALRRPLLIRSGRWSLMSVSS